MTATVDFAILSLQDTLDAAILVEEEALARYLDLAEQMEVDRCFWASTFFRRMSENEDRRRGQLLVHRSHSFLGEPRTVDRSILADFESPAGSRAHLVRSVRAALEAALLVERRVRRFYEAALPSVSDPQVQHLFMELYEEELHQEEQVLVELKRLVTAPVSGPATALEVYAGATSTRQS